MGRLFQSGFETNSVTTGHEWSSISGSPTISSATFRTGLYAGRISSLSSGTPQYFRANFVSSSSGGPYYFRKYFWYHTLPSAENTIFLIESLTATAVGKITLDSTGALRLYSSTATLIGSASSPLTADTPYRIEVKADASGTGAADTLEGKIEGTVFASKTNISGLSNMGRVSFGGNLASEAQTTGDWYFDDIAINDSSGSIQTGYPGKGAIIRLTPNGTGDSNMWNNTANASGSSNNYQLVDENPPNDATDMVQSGTLNDIDMYALSDSGLTIYDNIQVVAIGGRFRNNVADTVTSFRFRVEKTASGTITESADIIPNSSTFRTNSIDANIRNFPLVTYLDPDGAAWTNTTLDSMQIGLKLTAANVNRIQVTSIYVSVDYIAGSPPPAFTAKAALIT
jgi:hypothetical protein